MFRQGVRRLSTTAYKAAAMASQVDKSNQYGVQLAKAQGHVNGFVGGEGNWMNPGTIELMGLSYWKYSPHPSQTAIRPNRLRDIGQSRVSKSWR